jgi:hypothetical protein
MKAEDLAIDQGCEREVVEEIGEVFPDIGIPIFAEALVIEAIDLSDLTGFMVTTQNGNALWVADLKGDKESDGFNGIVTAINIVTFRRMRSRQ